MRKEGNSYCGGLLGTHQRSFEPSNGTIPDSVRPLLSQDWDSQSPPKTPLAIISETDSKFGRNIHRVHPNKSPLKFCRNVSVGLSRVCPIFWLPPVISGTAKAIGTSNLARTFIGFIRTKAH